MPGSYGVSDQDSAGPSIVLAEAATDVCDDKPQNGCAAPGTGTFQIADEPPNELDQTNAGRQPSQHPDESVNDDTEKLPVRYRPPTQKAPRPITARPVTPKVQRSAQAESALEIRVHLTFDRFYFCTIGLLPERFRELDGDIEAKDGKADLHLIAQEDWYEDLYFGDLGERLRRGVELKARLSENGQVRWLLTGRDVYVLASHPRASAYVSTARLALKRSDVVLCIAELLPQVEAILIAAGCKGYTRFGESHGVPPGWVGFRNVLPTIAIPLNSGSDAFRPIKPAPDLEIELESGVRLRNTAYLAGYPPQIKLYGEQSATVRVLIDGQTAQQTPEGAFVLHGYDFPGPHNVYCEGSSRSCTYSIEEPPDSWQEWPAYSFGQADICGPLVHLSAEAAQQRPFSVPMSNPLLIGAEPGQIFRCSSRKDASWKGFVPFDVVWALPAQPLICDKRTARILQFDGALPTPLKARPKSAIDGPTPSLMRRERAYA